MSPFEKESGGTWYGMVYPVTFTDFKIKALLPVPACIDIPAFIDQELPFNTYDIYLRNKFHFCMAY